MTILNALRKCVNYTTAARVGSTWFRIPSIAGVEVRGVRESFKTAIIRRFADERKVFIDAGANLGQTLLDLRASHGETGYVGFEPNPVAVAYIQRLIAINHFDGCRVVCAALSDHIDTLNLYSVPNDAADPGSTLRREQWPQSDHTSVQPVALLVFDIVAKSLNARPAGFVKIDVEGAELEVLRGMTGMLREDRPPVLCEVLPPCGGSSPAQSAERRTALLALLEDLEYDVYHVSPSADLSVVSEFSAAAYEPELSWDYLFLPAERKP